MKENEFFALLFLLLNVICYVFRNKFLLCKWLWTIMSAFWIALALVLAFGFVKEQFNKK